MKFIVFDAQSKHSKTETDPTITFMKSGLISLNEPLCKNLNLEVGSQIALLQDESKKKEWYLEKRSMNGLILRQGKSNGKALTVNCSKLVHALLQSLGKESKVKIPVASNPVDGGYYAILTSVVK